MKLIKYLMLLTVLLSFSCKRGGLGLFEKLSPYQRYVQGLERAGLTDSQMAQRWLSAGERSLTDSLVITLPYLEAGYISAEYPESYSFRFGLPRGRRLSVSLDVQSSGTGQVFVDLFEVSEGNNKLLESADSTGHIIYEPERDLQLLLRIQPELLMRVRYRLEISDSPLLGFPVDLKDYRAVGSFWGAARDAGVRHHEGVDIFADRGTPVLGSHLWPCDPSAGNAPRRKGCVGGSGKYGLNLYFAHLDSQLVRTGTRVRPGDVFGLVGNTGNAKHTPPHLHFGIYAGGAIDPYPFINDRPFQLLAVTADSTLIGERAKVSVTKANLRPAPTTNGSPRLQLDSQASVTILAATTGWYRVLLPDGQRGYLSASLVKSADAPIATVSVDSAAAIVDDFGDSGVKMRELAQGEPLEVLSRYKGLSYVRTSEGLEGWLK